MDSRLPDLVAWMRRIGIPIPGMPVEATVFLLDEPPAARLSRIQGALAIRLNGVGGQAQIRPFGDSGIVRAVGVTGTPPDLFRALETGTPWLTVLNRAVAVDTRAFEASLEAARRELAGDPLYERLLAVTQGWAVPRRNAPLIARECLLWAPDEFCGGAESASVLVDAEPVGFQDYGDLLYGVLQRRPTQTSAVNGVHPLLAVAPAEIQLAADHFYLGGRYQAIWSLIPQNPERLEELQALNVDILFHLENVEAQLWVQVLVKASSETREGLDELESALGAFGRVERIKAVHPVAGYDLARAFRAFVPGGLSPAGLNRFSVRSVEQFLRAAVARVNMNGAVAGDMFVGSDRGRPVFFSRAERPSVALIGQSGSGKTTTASFLALAQTPNVVVIHMTSTEGEAPAAWAKALDGQVLNLDLPGGKTPEEETKLIETDKQWTSGFWNTLLVKWLEAGEPIGLPIVLRRQSGDPIRFAALVGNFLTGYAETWKAFHEATGKVGALIVDDLAGIPGQAADVTLGNLSVEIGNGLRERVRLLIDTSRKLGFQLFLTAHSQGEFAEWPGGTWESLSLAIGLQTGAQHAAGTVLDPRDGRVLAKVNPRLPRALVQILGRRSDGLGLE